MTSNSGRTHTKLSVFASLAEDVNNGWIWVPESIINERTVVKIENQDTRKSTYCEAIPMGRNFVARYNKCDETIPISNKESSIVTNEWYRKKLGINSTQGDYTFKISKTNHPYGHLRASLSHPQIVVRLATELGLLGLLLGIISLFK